MKNDFTIKINNNEFSKMFDTQCDICMDFDSDFILGKLMFEFQT